MTPSLSVFLMDIWSVVPYYTSRLYASLREQGVKTTLGSMTYDLDPQCYSRAGIRNNPGWLDIVGRRRVNSPFVRKLLKFCEGSLNLLALSIRFLFSRPDIIHIHHIHFSTKGMPLQWWFLRYARLLGMRLVYTVHNVLPHENGERFRTRFAQLYREVDALICHSEAAKTRLIAEFQIDGSKIWVIPHGPLFDDLKSSMPKQQRTKWVSDEQHLFVCHGIIRPYKGIPFLLDAWSLVEKAEPAARLIVAGLADRNYTAELLEQSARLGLKQVRFEFRFLEPEEMIGLLVAADVLLYPYRDITTSGALMTGIAHRKRIIATDLPPFRQILQNDESALLVPYGDSEAMSESILTSMTRVENRLHFQVTTEAEGELTDKWAPIARHTLSCYEGALKRGANEPQMSRMDAVKHKVG